MQVLGANNYANVHMQVKIGFLPVGHTHEDIDQLFSCISRRLKHRNAMTIPGKVIPTYPLILLPCCMQN